MDYYKILNRHECHHGLQYNTGLNIDPVVFNPSGDCEPGGIYFSREDILYFLDYGPYIRKVTLPEDAKIYKNPGEPKKWKADKVILGEREEINLEVIKRLIDEGADPNIDNSYPLRWAVNNKYTDIVKLLIPVSNSKIANSQILRLAVEHGYTEIVEMLIPVSDPKINDSSILKYATDYGHTNIVKLLIPVSDPKADNSMALQRAALNGYTEIVKLLIPVSEINDDIIEFCKTYCHNQKLLDLIIANKHI